ncbi:MAG TPA: methyltransferase domain-containing protein [Thermoanaerobaculia bacterium]
MPRGTPLDLRPQRPLWRTLRLPVGSTASQDLQDLKECSLARPAVTYSGPRAVRDSAELFSAAADSFRPGDRLLDLGCGSGDQVPVAAHYGLRYAGVDYSSPNAGMLADAHALPFSDTSFDLVLSYAVFEHLHNPYMAATEVARVLAPGGLFFGAVSQGEPFHESYFHHTALGVLALLNSTGFRVRRLWPSYDTLHALATMGRYPRITRILIEILYRFVKATPFLAPRAFFRSSQREKELEALYRTAGICFVAERVSTDGPPIESSSPGCDVQDRTTDR